MLANPFANEPCILACRQASTRTATSSEHKISRLAAGHVQIFVKRKACLLGQLPGKWAQRRFVRLNKHGQAFGCDPLAK